MTTTFKVTMAAMLIAPFMALFASVVVPATTQAANLNAQCQTGQNNLSITEGVDCAKGEDQSRSLFGGNGGGQGIFVTITNVLLFIIGAIAVIMLIIGGIRYTISGGDSSQVTSAKNTILYAIVGIIVAILAYAVVNFVVGSLVS